jgi:hypothetical protein
MVQNTQSLRVPVPHVAIEAILQFLTMSDHQHSRISMTKRAALALELHNVCTLEPPEDDADDDHEEDYQAAHETAHPLRPREDIGGEGSIDCQRGRREEGGGTQGETQG